MTPPRPPLPPWSGTVKEAAEVCCDLGEMKAASIQFSHIAKRPLNNLDIRYISK